MNLRAAAVGLCAAATVFVGAVVAEAEPAPGAVVAEDPAWVNPILRDGDPGGIVLDELSLAAPTISGSLTLTPRALSAGDTSITATQVQVFVSPVTQDSSVATELLGLNPAAFTAPGPVIPVDNDHATFSFTDADLGLTEPGIYAIMFQAGPATTRFLVTVPADNEPADRAPVSLIWPLAAEIPLVAGETGTAPESPTLILANESLADDLAGRLTDLLTLYPGEGACLAVDPQLIDTVDRMARGYEIGTERPSITDPAPRLRDQWTQQPESANLTPGAHSDIARTWLDQLKEVAAGQCVLTYPWGGADLDAVSSIDGLLAHTFAPHHVEEILGTPVNSEVIVDPVGITPATTYLGEHPVTGASTPLSFRFDYTLDSPVARRATSEALLAFTRGATGAGADSPADAAVVVPPPLLEAADAAMLAQVTTGPHPFPQAHPATDYLAAATNPTGGAAPRAVISADVANPGPNPAAPTDADRAAVADQITYIGGVEKIMQPSPSITLTPQEFTEPLYRCLASTFTTYNRDSLHEYQRVLAAGQARLAAVDAMIDHLRASVSLLPPGNVYTRTSPNSPLPVVARNGLPLPVAATVVYDTAGDVRLGNTELTIPARGSITTQLTSQIPATTGEGVDITLRLAAPDGTMISEPVTVTVLTTSARWLVWPLVAIFVLALVVRWLIRRRR
ncbi:MAG: DUF6049 family protein [Corynebacterium sp.]|nr:DUF6049 family protein [Corynebacterium sp.]